MLSPLLSYLSFLLNSSSESRILANGQTQDDQTISYRVSETYKGLRNEKVRSGSVRNWMNAGFEKLVVCVDDCDATI